jgi:nitrile hydratase accessory protein
LSAPEAVCPPDPPVFDEPWQAEAFALVVHLHAAGAFTWTEWAGVLSARIEAAERDGEPVDGDLYHRHWLAALEDMVTDRGLSSRDALAWRKEQWAAAYQRTPHGQPVTLDGPA